MAIRIKSRGGESADQMLRRFKKLCEKEGLVKDIKRKEYFEKPSDRARREAVTDGLSNTIAITGSPGPMAVNRSSIPSRASASWIVATNRTVSYQSPRFPPKPIVKDRPEGGLNEQDGWCSAPVG